MPRFETAHLGTGRKSASFCGSGIALRAIPLPQKLALFRPVPRCAVSTGRAWYAGSAQPSFEEESPPLVGSSPRFFISSTCLLISLP